MPDFVWRAADASGKVVEGQLNAGSSALAMKQLRDRGLTPLRLDDAASTAGQAAAVNLPGQAPKPRKTRVARGLGAR
jgi:general secretion pathway protein F